MAMKNGRVWLHMKNGLRKAFPSLGMTSSKSKKLKPLRAAQSYQQLEMRRKHLNLYRENDRKESQLKRI